MCQLKNNITEIVLTKALFWEVAMVLLWWVAPPLLFGHLHRQLASWLKMGFFWTSTSIMLRHCAPVCCYCLDSSILGPKKWLSWEKRGLCLICSQPGRQRWAARRRRSTLLALLSPAAAALIKVDPRPAITWKTCQLLLRPGVETF